MSFVRLAAVAAVLAAISLPARAQDALPPHAGVHVLTAGPDGGLSCDVAAEAQVDGLHDASARTSGRAVRLTALPSLNADRNAEGGAGFRIVLRATDQLLDRPAALLAFRRAAARWERILQTDLTTVIDVDYGPERFGTPYPSNVLGSTSSVLTFAGTASAPAGPASMVARLKERTDDPQLLALYDAIPVPTPSTSELGALNRGLGGLISLQVLGYASDFVNPSAPFGDVPSIGFNDAFPYDFDPTDGIDPSRTDFEGVALHEIGHALGFTSAIGISSTGTDPLFTPWDLFRVRPEAVEPGESLTDGAGFETAERVVTPGPPNTEVLVVENGQEYYAPVQVFFDGIEEYEVSTATGNREGGDGQQASHWRDDALRPPSLGAGRKIGLMDPNIGRGELDELTDADIRVLEVIGFDVDYDPPVATVALSVAGQAVDDRFLVVEPLDIGDVAAGTTAQIPVVVGNEDDDTPLSFRVEAELLDVSSTGQPPTFSVVSGMGTLAPGGSTTLQLRVGGLNGQAIAIGVVRVISNDENRAVIEVPVTFTVGGGNTPLLSVGDVGDLGNLGNDETRTLTVPLTNTGSFDLNYRLFTSFMARSFAFPNTSPSDARRVAGAVPVFTADFEGANPLAGFQYNVKAAPDRWQARSDSRTALPGHSAPTALYYGDTGGGQRYSDNTLGQIQTPGIDLSTLNPGSRVTLSFATFLLAQAGADFATVSVSFDGGATYEELATSDGGVLRNTPDGWETVELEVPGAAGYPVPIRFAFRFDSDASVTGPGWYIDDIVVDVVEGQAPFVVTPVVGVVPANGTLDLEVTVDAGVLDAGFYEGRIELETNQLGDDPDPIEVTFSVGDPSVPTLALASPISTVSIAGGQVAPFGVALRNEGDATLTFVRVLEPATSRFEGTPIAPGTAGSDDGDVLGAVAFGTSPEFFDLAQLADGRIVLFDGAERTSTTAYVLPRDLSDPGESFSSDALGSTVTGVAYNTLTGSLWIALSETGELVEVTLEGGAVVPTGRAVDLDVTPFGLDYSPELDAFLVGSLGTEAVLAVTVDGDLLPGYPAFVAGRDLDDGATEDPGLSFTRGLLETTGAADVLLARDQFGAAFGGVGLTFSEAVLAGSRGVYGLLRDRLDPDASFFVTTRPGDGAQARLVRLDPPDLPDLVDTIVEAARPPFADRSLEPGETLALAFQVDARELAPGDRPDEVTFLTNSPAMPVVRIPLTLAVTSVAAEDGADGAFAFSGVHPNPTGGDARVRFALAGAADVTVAVFDALGRRVSVLADGAPFGAGLHDLAFPTAALAPGVYVVRVTAGAEGATRTVTVVR